MWKDDLLCSIQSMLSDMCCTSGVQEMEFFHQSLTCMPNAETSIREGPFVGMRVSGSEETSTVSTFPENCTQPSTVLE
jgi:hypothetical protein